MWRPLITAPEERARLLTVVREIAEAVRDLPVDRRAIGAHCDRAMLLTYLAQDDSVPDDGAALEHLAAAIAAQAEAPGALGLHGGLAGVGWTITHLAGDANAEELCASIDTTLLHVLGDEWPNGYDLVSGLVGFGVYALEREQAGRPLLARVLELLAATAQRRGPGLAWETPARLLPEHQRADAPDGYWNLGLAHGTPGVIALSARCIALGADEARARELLTGAVSYLLDAEPADDSGRFSAWHRHDGSRSGDRTRLAWCYGDLGVAPALLAAARVDARWDTDARRLAHACAVRPRAASIRDTAICHGSIGVAHALNRMYQATGDHVLADAARRWLAVTLEMRNDHACAGFPAFDGVTLSWREDAALLTGAAGVALVLHAMVSDVEPLWDRTLLLDLEPS